jgi:hypothetical protein
LRWDLRAQEIDIMSIRQLPAACLILLVMASGCTSLKRFRSATYVGRDDSLVDMALFGATLARSGPETAGKNLWDLSASAQTQLIQILNERYPDNEQFTGALNREYLAEGPANPVDYTGMDLRMVFTISRQRNYAGIGPGKGLFSPADRIEQVKFTLRIPPEYNLSFTGWNRYTTEYGEIEIADVSFSRSLDLEADYSGEMAGMVAKGALRRTEEQQVRSRYLKLNGSISGQQIEIEEEGTRGIDLTGNVIADVSLQFEGFPERITIPLFSGPEGSPAPEVSALRFIDVLVPRMENVPEAIMGTLEMEYVYRHVRSGWKTFQEWDDRVAYYQGRVEKQIPLFKKQEYLPSFYCLGTDLDTKQSVKIRTGTGQEYPLQFRNYHEAARFYEWLVISARDQEGIPPEEAIIIGDHTLVYMGRSLTRRAIAGGSRLKVMPVYE